MHDLGPAAREMTRLVQGVRDDQLGDPTPCTTYALGDLLQHVRGLAEAFTLAGRKEQPDGGSKPPPQGDASLLPARWRDEPDHAIPGGDSGAGFMERYDAAIARIASDGHESALAVSHGAAMRVWCSASLGLPADFFDGRRLDNAHVVTMEGDPVAGWRLLAWGDEPVTHG